MNLLINSLKSKLNNTKIYKSLEDCLYSLYVNLSSKPFSPKHKLRL